MFRMLSDFHSVWKDEAEMTQKVLGALTDASLAQAINNDHRTLGRIAWHLTQTIPEMLGKAGAKASGPGEHDAVPTSAKAIVEAYVKASASVSPAIAAAKWTDATLAEEREMYGEKWTVGFTLRAFVFHQAHHRGQISVLMRQAGLPMPPIYGPTKEEWAQWGMQPPAI